MGCVYGDARNPLLCTDGRQVIHPLCVVSSHPIPSTIPTGGVYGLGTSTLVVGCVRGDARNGPCIIIGRPMDVDHSIGDDVRESLPYSISWTTDCQSIEVVGMPALATPYISTMLTVVHASGIPRIRTESRW